MPLSRELNVPLWPKQTADQPTELLTCWAVEDLTTRSAEIKDKKANRQLQDDVEDIAREFKTAEVMSSGPHKEQALRNVFTKSKSTLTKVAQVIDTERKEAFAAAKNAVLFVVDVSGSMMSRLDSDKSNDFPIDPKNIRAHAARKLVERRLAELKAGRPDLVAGLFLFDTELHVVVPVTSVLEDVNKKLDQIEITGKFRGGTDLYFPAGPEADPLMIKAAKMFASTSSPLKNRLIVVVSDVDLSAPPPSEEGQIAKALADRHIEVEVHKLK